MKAFKLIISIILFQTLTSQVALAGAWSRTDSNAKTVANASLKLEKNILKIKALPDDNIDKVAKRDAIDDDIVNTEIKLQEALEVLLYWAYKSPNQKRYMKRVSLNVTASQLKAMERILKTLSENEAWMTEEYALDYIEKQAESWAKNDVMLAQQNISKKTQNIAHNIEH